MPNFDDEDLPVATKSASLATSNNDLDVDWGDTDAVANTDGLERIVPADKTSKVRVAVLTHIVKPKMAWLHYVQVGEKKQTIRCLSKRDKKHIMLGEADCCKKLNHDNDQRAQLNFAVLALKYKGTNADTGKYPSTDTPIAYELGWLKLSRAGFKNVGELVLEGEKAEDMDFTISNRSNGIGYDYKRISQKAKWKSNPDLVAEVTEEAQKFADGALLSKRLGKIVTDVDLRNLLKPTSATAPGAAIDNTDDL